MSTEWKWKRVPIEDLEAPKRGGLHMVLRDHYWAVDSERRAFFYGDTSPQCNSNRAIVERMKTHPDMVDIVFVPVAMFAVSIRDYV